MYAPENNVEPMNVRDKYSDFGSFSDANSDDLDQVFDDYDKHEEPQMSRSDVRYSTSSFCEECKRIVILNDELLWPYIENTSFTRTQ
jgi:hypothetical protein